MTKVMGDGCTNKAMTVWGAVLSGQWKIMHSVNKALKDLTGSLVVINIPNPMHHKGLLVAIKGEYMGTFLHQVTHERQGNDWLAICRVVMQREGFLDNATTTTLKLWAGDLTLVAETKKERRLNCDVLREEHDAARLH